MGLGILSPYALEYLDDVHELHSFDKLRIGISFPNGALVGYEVMFPYWLVCMALIVLPITRLTLNYRRQRRITADFCVTCGYDLRASKQRCPECGTTVNDLP